MSIPDLDISPKSATSRAGINEALTYARSLVPMIDAAHRAAQQKLSLTELERLYSIHSSEFSLPPQQLKSIVIDGLSTHWSGPIEKFRRAKFTPPSPPSLTSYISAATGWFKATLHFGAIRKQPDNAAELQQHRQKTALLFEHFGDSDRAFTTRMSIAKTPYSVENAFAIARLLEKKLPYATFKTFLTNHFKERSSDFMLASARRDAFAKQDKENAAERAAFLERIRFSAEREPEHIGLQLALGFAELASGNADGALCQFTMAWVLNEQRRRAAIDRGQPAPEGEQVDPWSLAYAFACASEGPQARSYGIFRPIDSMRLNLAGAKMLRAEGAGLAALSFYGTLVNTSFAGRPPLKHIAYRNFWITYYQDRWVAVPRSFVLSWILPVTLGSGMPATVRKASKWKQIRGIKLWIGTVRKASKWKQIRGIKLWIGNRIASLIRFGRRLPGSKVALRLFARFRNFVFQRFGSRFGVLFASELSTLKQKIDVLSR